MKILLTQLSSYHLWANNLLIDKLKTLPAELALQDIPSSFPNINATVYHVWNSESVWWQRIKLQEPIVPVNETFISDFNALADGWKAQSKQLHEWIINAQEHVFDHEMIYYNSKKEKFKQKICEVLLHIFNHGTYHRGQLVTMLHQLEIGSIPATDFIVWSRKRGVV